METLDLKKAFGPLLKPSAKQPQLVDIPELPFLMIDGEGAPAEGAFGEAIGALYSTAYTMKFAVRKARGIDYPVMALEALWWMAEGQPFSYQDRGGWRWTAMIVLPSIITPDDVAEAVAAANKKKPNPALASVALRRFSEGRAAQIMHIGPYSAEPPTIDALHAWVGQQGLRLHGKHHEIYLSDPARTAPERMKTIIRHPVEG